MKKRILSTLLALAMCLSLLPTSALATEKDGREISNSSELASLFREGGKGYLKDSKIIELDGGLTVSTKVELDLNGQKITDDGITVANGASLTLTGNGTVDSLGTSSGGSVTLTDRVRVCGVSAWGGELVAQNASIETLQAGNGMTHPYSTVEIKGGTIEELEVHYNAKVTLSDVALDCIVRWGATIYSNVPSFEEMLADGYAYQHNTDDDKSLNIVLIKTAYPRKIRKNIGDLRKSNFQIVRLYS